MPIEGWQIVRQGDFNNDARSGSIGRLSDQR
jgi:hypothetical protein